MSTIHVCGAMASFCRMSMVSFVPMMAVQSFVPSKDARCFVANGAMFSFGSCSQLKLNHIDGSTLPLASMKALSILSRVVAFFSA